MLAGINRTTAYKAYERLLLRPQGGKTSAGALCHISAAPTSQLGEQGQGAELLGVLDKA